MIAARLQDARLCALFLAQGADPNAFDRSITTALEHAALFDSPASVSALLAGGANPNHQNAYGVSFLRACANNEFSAHIASAWMDSPSSKQAGPSLNTLLEGASLLDASTRSGQVAMTRWLLDHGANPLAGDLEKSVAEALSEGHREAAHLALEALQQAQFAPKARPAAPSSAPLSPSPQRSAP